MSDSSEVRKADVSVKASATKGYLCVIGAAVMWASSGTAGKVLFQAGMTPFELVQIRVTFSAVILALTFGLFGRRFFTIRLRDIAYFALLGGIALVLVQLSYFLAISKIQVAAAILLEYLAPIIVAVYSMCFWHERVTTPKLSALFLAIAGCYLVAGGYNLELLHMNRLGILWGLIAAVSFASYTLLGERGMYHYHPWTVIFYAFCFAALSLNIIHKPFNYLYTSYNAEQWWYLFYIITIGTILPFSLYFIGVNYIRSTRTMITATLEPISAAFMAYFLLGEVLEPLQVAGGLSVVAAIVVLQLQKEHDEMAPERIREKEMDEQ
jgi:drug/metabolite transporter (DMT)-like permease